MNPYPWTALAANLGVTLAAVLVLMVVALAVGVRRGRHDGVDVVWGLGFVLIALVSAVTATLLDPSGDAWRRVLVVVLVTVWGGRLARHIARRNHGKPEDRRYVDLLARAPGNPAAYAFRKVYLTQGAVMWVVSLPVQIAPYGAVGTWGVVVTVLGMLVWAVGFGFEAVGDAQLARFTADPAHRGEVLDSGLWRYTRHPNYFGDACVWWGLGLLALAHPAGLIGLVGVAVITANLVKGTGAALLERDIADRRPGYADYVRRTSGFLPLPPRAPRPQP
ncbi:hypothetical protein Ae168Ps1_5099c [Pseudonocardia sp. Ae168_Ps1]|uniref:DUF1295 domain-containing protein n=1 Tax=unclassified Pseudonocardia TaxID=2619320 RepID=UPI00094AE109|nr:MULTISPECIES: DUF1295 domain-containing protein [unclassified Pseudonocardia]OLL76682.1 hypothetical protein Ae150APs1_5060c [Pseudonocardia sp. Ae150A_Ps1]OLL82693.1 hypothetical protein Ae168Ps1_5099c [Pseudonocardia sp. Ae168_Ps1]OLL83194.1 hypothetical protein Ae263Ps1_0249 [Pseudonocardia sp. Ae263_Ps1]OLL90768.1 hypothetical protein Ae356Ps1_0665c [Pseudonocardia sp. Ae356_Ps1]